MTSFTKVTDWEKMMLRLPPGMRERIATSAKERGRSMNADVIARIEASFKIEEEAYDSLQTNEELREFVNARFDEVESSAREQRLAFEHMMSEARKLLGDELVDVSLERAKKDVRREARSKPAKDLLPNSEKAREVVRNHRLKSGSKDSG